MWIPRLARHPRRRRPTAKRDMKELLDGSTKTLGEAVFTQKFPAAEENEKAFLTPQTIDSGTEKHF